MAKSRAKYNKSAKIEWSDQDHANHYVALLSKEMAASPNLAAIVNALRNEKPAIQRRVTRALLPPKSGKPGQPRRKFPDELILEAVESGKSELAKRGESKITDRAAVKFLLEMGWLHMGRSEETPFNLASTAGRQEMDRAIAAVVRARKAKKSKIPRG